MSTSEGSIKSSRCVSVGTTVQGSDSCDADATLRLGDSAVKELKVVVDDEKRETVTTADQSSTLAEDFPEGGLRAWLVVFGGMCTTFSTFGLVNSWGVFQSYYKAHILEDISPSQLAWIGSLQYSFTFIPGLIVGRLFDIGYFKLPFAVASILFVVATFLVAECTKYWHFLLCQGFILGFNSGVLFAPISPVVAHWFKKRRGFAIGIVAVGSSIGGTIFPIASRNLIPRVGFPWTMRILGFILMISLGTANLTLRRRLPPTLIRGGLINLRNFKSAPYSIYCASAFVAFLGLYTVLTYIVSSATLHGVDPDFAFYLVAIANAASGLGRICSGFISDRIGTMNNIIPMTLVCAIITFAWPFASDKSSLIVIAILYGFFVGAYVALAVVPVMAMGSTEDVGRRCGMFLTVLALGALCGPPMSGAINSATRGFNVVGYYAGGTIMASVFLMCWSRYLVLGKVWGKF